MPSRSRVVRRAGHYGRGCAASVAANRCSSGTRDRPRQRSVAPTGRAVGASSPKIPVSPPPNHPPDPLTETPQSFFQKKLIHYLLGPSPPATAVVAPVPATPDAGVPSQTRCASAPAYASSWLPWTTRPAAASAQPAPTTPSALTHRRLAPYVWSWGRAVSEGGARGAAAARPRQTPTPRRCQCDRAGCSRLAGGRPGTLRRWRCRWRWRWR